MSGLPGFLSGLQSLLDLTGFQQTGLPLATQPSINSAARVTRSIDSGNYNLLPEVTIEEDSEDTLEITQHPVEQGAAITDHAYKRPAEVRMRLGWSDRYTGTGNNQLYSNILDLQASRRPFSIQTGKRAYSDMLVADIRQHTDARFEYSLIIDITFRQILLVNTQTTQGSPTGAQGAQADPEANAPYTASGAIQPAAVSLTDDQLTSAGADQDFSGGIT